MGSSPLPDGLAPVLSTEEVAELLRLNPKTVLAMARDGRLPAHRLAGCRKVQYLTSEILAAVSDAPGIEETNPPSSHGDRSGRTAASEVDPCDVWGPAPAGLDDDQLCQHWVELARVAGLSPVPTSDRPPLAEHPSRSAGLVAMDELVYNVLVGPRQRTRYVDDDGEFRWGLIDAVWVEPLSEVRAERI